jgi:hypothetical protein
MATINTTNPAPLMTNEPITLFIPDHTVKSHQCRGFVVIERAHQSDDCDTDISSVHTIANELLFHFKEIVRSFVLIKLKFG